VQVEAVCAYLGASTEAVCAYLGASSSNGALMDGWSSILGEEAPRKTAQCTWASVLLALSQQMVVLHNPCLAKPMCMTLCCVCVVAAGGCCGG
jgi:hypothetical protein